MTEEFLLRLDKWLWYARFCKSRTLAAKLCASGRIHLDGAIVQKPHHQVRAGNVLTFPLGPHVRVIRILALGSRRGPAPEARLLYEDLQPPDPSAAREPPLAPRARGSGRPTKAERRAIDRLQNEKSGRE
ncbi:MAG TPA: RNA-binding S4 domain-containing protein [Dongiaceae bacterium]|jgi:ribosome-associated heat shock protein Hsp15